MGKPRLLFFYKPLGDAGLSFVMLYY